jgi:hypothetical protein
MTDMAKYQLSKWFARGAGHAVRFHGSDTVLFQWNGKPDGHARYIPHVNRYARNGAEFASLAALLRAVEAEHAN